jgi:Protein of unknown function (DUF3761)
MSRSIAYTTLLAALLFTAACPGQAPVGAPAGTTALCKDGSFSTSATKQGACSGHKGIKQWYVTAGQVWANKDTHTYHCQGDQWYGKTANGAYMSESDAKAQGFHPDRGNACK